MQPHFISIPIQGLTNAEDVVLIERTLAQLKEASQPNVDFNNKRIILQTPVATDVLPTIINKLTKLGFYVPTTKKSFPVLHLACASCASSAQTILQHTEGVIDAQVNYATQTATLTFFPEITGAYKLKSALQSVGYDLLLEEDDENGITIENIKDNAYKNLKKRTWGAIILTLPLIVVSMVFMDMPYANYIMWALATPVVFVFGAKFFRSAFMHARHKSANMDTLVAMSTGIAYLYSVFNTLFPQIWIKQGIHPHVYFEASAAIISFILLGKMLEEKAKNNTSFALKKLIGLQPNTVTLVDKDNEYSEIPVSSVKKGDTILIKAGEKIPVDGYVVNGHSYVDESMITGEPIAVLKNKGDKVFAGTINQKGSFTFNAEKLGSETLLGRIITMVRDAQGSKPAIQKLTDKIAGIFVPVVMALATLTLLIWIVWGGENAISHGILAFVTVLVIACPCALGLATPTAVMVGIGKGAEKGILVKDAESLQTLKKIDTIVLDKTGTITEGKPQVKSLQVFDNQHDIKDLIFSFETRSDHPLADAVCNYLQNDAKQLENIQVETIIGKGIIGEYENQKYFIGSINFLKENNISVMTETQKWIHANINENNTLVLFSNDKNILAGIAISDTIKENAPYAVKRLKKAKIDVHMLTGDNENTAQFIGQKTGIKKVISNTLPEDKILHISNLQKSGKIVAMVGDGINDSAALAQADVGIAMGKGSDIAMDVAEITIISGDLNKISEAITLSHQTVSTIYQNLFWAFIYNIIAIPVAAGILYPINGFLLNPMIAGAAMALSSISVVTNSLRLKYKS